MTDTEMTRRSILFAAAASLICAPAIVRAASLMPVRGLSLQRLNPARKIPMTAGDWYQQCFYNNLNNQLRAGHAMTHGPIGGPPISVAEGYRIVAQARAEGWLPPFSPAIQVAHPKRRTDPARLSK
jgi:hypothetical protein